MTQAVEFDFATKRERSIPITEAAGACAEGKFCWIDLDVALDQQTAEDVLRSLGVVPEAIDGALTCEAGGRYVVYGECLHFSVTGVALENDRLVECIVDTLLGNGYLITIHRGDVPFLEQIRRTYSHDFQRFAQSPSFLLYEFWDHLIGNYKKVAQQLTGKVRQVQDEIFGDIDDVIFSQVASLSRNLLTLRGGVLSAREILSTISTRRSSAIAETTLPFLEKMVVMLERIGADLVVEKETLAETLNLYMGIVAHRTNRIINLLTVISVVFLPLTFLCGVYGMNFEIIPEVTWKYGYLYFWITSAVITVSTLAFMKFRKWW